MGMRIIKTAYTKTGEYIDGSGTTKSRYFSIGKLFRRDDGSISLKIDAIPTGGWDGWINFSDPRPHEAQEAAPAARTAGTQAERARYQADQRAQAPSSPAAPDFDDDIPF